MLFKTHILLKSITNHIPKVYSFTILMLEIPEIEKLSLEKNAINQNQFLTVSKLSKVIVASEK